jgi:hypothetical protein
MSARLSAVVSETESGEYVAPPIVGEGYPLTDEQRDLLEVVAELGPRGDVPIRKLR